MKKVLRTESDRQEFIRELKKAPLKTPLVAEFKQFRIMRSLSQNNLYWMWLRCIQDETGNDLEDLHDYFAGKYLSAEMREVFGYPVYRRQSTADLNTEQFTWFLDQVDKEAMSRLQIYLPQPGLPGWEEFYEKYRTAER